MVGPKKQKSTPHGFSKISLSIKEIQWFPVSILIFGQTSCFLGPTILETPQPN
jgi:hypothetical protein